MNRDPMYSKVRCYFGGDNSGKGYNYLSSCAPNLQVISAVNNLIDDTKKTRLLQEINPKPDENAKRNYVCDWLVEDASVNDRWCAHSRNKCGRAQPEPAFVQDSIFEGDYLHRCFLQSIKLRIEAFTDAGN
jgi:hypothetical protein